jgi:hypothetical protein
MPKWIITSPSGYRWHNVHGWIDPEKAAVAASTYTEAEKQCAAMPAGGCWMELKPMEKPVCSECGSDDIKTDAYAIWDAEKQDWVLDTAFEKPSVCEKCGGECSLEWVEVE